MKNRYRVISSRASVTGCVLLLAGCGNSEAGSGAGGVFTGQDGTTDTPASAGGVNERSGSADDTGDVPAESGQVDDSTGTGGPAAGGEQPSTGAESGTGGPPPGTDGDSVINGPLDLGGPPGGPASGGEPEPVSASSCVGNAWPTADPTNPGPFQVTTEANVGPMAGALPDLVHGDMQPQFNVYRPSDLGQGGFCHPIITWGNGHSDQPRTYEVLLKQLASHGFVVIASLSSIVSQGNPPPMIVGVNWLIQQNDDPSSQFYRRLDTAHIGATGHSEGGAATTNAGSDSNVLTIAPIAGASAMPNLHGPALLQCGGMDTQVPCSRVMNAFDAITDLPVMLLVNVRATHGSWIGSIKDPYMEAVTGWMRLHLMGDTALRSMFFGPNCMFCQDARVQVMRKRMDQ